LTDGSTDFMVIFPIEVPASSDITFNFYFAGLKDYPTPINYKLLAGVAVPITITKTSTAAALFTSGEYLYTGMTGPNYGLKVNSCTTPCKVG